MKKLAITTREVFDLVRSNLERPCISIDIATFRIGSNEHMPEFICELALCAPVRILIGLGVARDNGPSSIDPCVAIAEEVLVLAEQKKTRFPVSIRYLHECHLKCWLFHRPQLRNMSALIGGKNLVFSPWPDFLVEVDSTIARPVSKLFESSWNRGTDVKPTDFMRIVIDGRKF